jgi:hypothetical protein
LCWRPCNNITYVFPCSPQFNTPADLTGLSNDNIEIPFCSGSHSSSQSTYVWLSNWLTNALLVESVCRAQVTPQSSIRHNPSSQSVSPGHSLRSRRTVRILREKSLIHTRTWKSATQNTTFHYMKRSVDKNRNPAYVYHRLSCQGLYVLLAQWATRITSIHWGNSGWKSLIASPHAA